MAENNFIKSLAESRKKGFAQNYSDNLKKAITCDWFFSGWEKIVIVVCFLWTVYSLGKFIWALF